jgi:hypothetical protein
MFSVMNYYCQLKKWQAGREIFQKSAFLPLALFLATALFTLPGPEL